MRALLIMPTVHKTEIAIIGAGIVGLSCAALLSTEGFDVLLIDPESPGSGASFGNAASISPHAISPVGSPAVLRQLPHLLFNPQSPLSIRIPYLPVLMPWLARFTAQSFQRPFAHNQQVMAELQTRSMSAWREMANLVGLNDQIVERGVLYTYPDKASLEAAQSEIRIRREHGIQQIVLNAGEVRQLEPNLPACAGGIHHIGSTHLKDPGVATGQIAQFITSSGASILKERVHGVKRERSGVCLQVGNKSVLAKQVIIATGAHSAKLARQVGDHIPLISHRGYHIEFDMDELPISRPVHRTQLGFYLTPLNGRLRAAGTVELASNEASPSARRFEQIEKGVRSTFPNLPPVSRQWMGLRPALPDSLPVIGSSSKGSDIIYAFGHGHVGMTLGPITARLVTSLIKGEEPELSLDNFSARRFRSGIAGVKAQ